MLLTNLHRKKTCLADSRFSVKTDSETTSKLRCPFSKLVDSRPEFEPPTEHFLRSARVRSKLFGGRSRWCCSATGRASSSLSAFEFETRFETICGSTAIVTFVASTPRDVSSIPPSVKRKVTQNLINISYISKCFQMKPFRN